jgi:hypothetical protein
MFIIFVFLTPGSGMGKKIKIRNRDKHPGSHFRELGTIFGLKILKCFDVDPESGIFSPWIRDPRGKTQTGINIPDPQHCP